MVNRDTDEEKASEFFLSTVSEIAFQYDCKLLGCGYDEDIGWWVELGGLSRQQDKALTAIGKAFKKWEIK